MKERGPAQALQVGVGHGRGRRGAARSGRHLDRRSADPGGHSVQHQGVRPASRPQSWKDLADAGMNGPPRLLLQRQRRRRAALYTLAKHFGWDLVQGACRDQAAACADAAGHHASARARRARRGLPAERQHRLALQTAGQADRLRVPGRGRADRDRRAAACSRARRARTPPLSSTSGGWARRGRSSLSKGGKYSSRTDVAPPPGAARSLSKLKLLTLDPQPSTSKNNDKILDQMAAIFGGEWGNLSARESARRRAQGDERRHRPGRGPSGPSAPVGSMRGASAAIVLGAGGGAPAAPGRLSAALAVAGRAWPSAVFRPRASDARLHARAKLCSRSSTRCSWRWAPAS